MGVIMKKNDDKFLQKLKKDTGCHVYMINGMLRIEPQLKSLRMTDYLKSFDELSEYIESNIKS